MPDLPEVNSTLLESMSMSSEPVLTTAVQKKIALLPELRRLQLLEQRGVRNKLLPPRNDQAETETQSFDQVAELKLGASYTSKDHKPATTTRYTITGRMPHIGTPAISSLTEPVPRMSRPPLVNKESRPYLQSSPPIGITDFSAHHGETAVLQPPIISNDLQSRLEGLRQYKEWSTRIHSPTERTEPDTNVSHQHDASSTNVTISIRKNNSAQDEETACLGRSGKNLPNGEDQIIERNILAPTPFCSSQITSVPVIAIKENQQSCSESPSTLELVEKLPQDLTAHGRPRAHSKTIVISSKTLDVQLAEGSTTSSSKNLPAPQRANSRSKSHPPISFPSDFYERFPAGESSSTSGNEQNLQPSSGTIRATFQKTTPADKSTKITVPGEIGSLALPSDTQLVPEFYNIVHYFTECDHLSPPANRPLDAKGQPRQDPNFKPTKHQSVRSIIPGACFTCDLARRRDEEDDVIDTSTAQLAGLADELAEALDELELNDSDDDKAGSAHDKHLVRLLATSRFAEDKHDLDFDTQGMTGLPPSSDDPEFVIVPGSERLQTPEKQSHISRVILRIRELERQIQRVRDEQEEQIKKVWAGFTPRWGPGTLGLQHRGRATSPNRAALMGDKATREQHKFKPATGANTVCESKLGGTDATGQDGTYIGADNGESSTSSHDTSRSRSGGSSSSRSPGRDATPSSIGSVVSPRDMPGSRTPGKGKMKIGWIREEKYTCRYGSCLDTGFSKDT